MVDQLISAVIRLITLPLSAVFYLLLGIHNGIEWLYDRLAGERD